MAFPILDIYYHINSKIKFETEEGNRCVATINNQPEYVWKQNNAIGLFFVLDENAFTLRLTRDKRV
jgi:hypothetical protein